MTRPLVFRPEVREDVDGAYAWYEKQRSGLGDRYLQSLRDLLDRIDQSPEAHAIIHRDVRAACMRRFPYVAYYRVEQDRTVVIAVMHGRRAAREWQARV